METRSELTKLVHCLKKARSRGDPVKVRCFQEKLFVELVPLLMRGARARKFFQIGVLIEIYRDENPHEEYPCEIMALVSEACIKILLNLDSYDEAKADFERWAMRIARNCWIDLGRRERALIRGGGKVDQCDIDDPSVEGQLMSEEEGYRRVEFLLDIRNTKLCGRKEELLHEWSSEYCLSR